MNLAGYVAARVGSSVVTAVAGLLFCAAVPLLALAPSLPILALSLAVFGAAGGSTDVAMNTQGVAVERRYGRPILTSFHAFYSLGGLLGAALAGLASGQGIAPLPQFTVISVLCAASLLVAARALLPAIAFCTVLSEGAIANWSAIYLQHTVGTGAALAAGGYAAFSLMMAAGRLVGDNVTMHAGHQAVVRFGPLLAAAGMMLALFVPSTLVAIAGFGLVGAGLCAVFPIVISAAGRSKGISSGNAVASVATCGYFGYLVGPPAIGFVAQVGSVRFALLLIVVLCLLATAISSRVGEM
jgi:MFS family permease